jgi:signal transduction histidine kinase
MLYDLISQHRTEVLDHCLQQLRGTYPDRNDGELLESLPTFVDEVIERLRPGQADAALTPGDVNSPTVQHGLVRRRQGFEIASVVRDYALVCEVVSDLAIEYGETPAPQEFQVLTRCVDEAIACAVESYRVEERTFEARERAEFLGILAHELRNAVSTALIGFEMIRKGKVAVDGRTAEVVTRALAHSTHLINQTLAETRLASGLTAERQRLRVSNLFAEVAAGAFPERDIVIDLDVPPELDVVGDPRLLLSTLSNLLQNAIKFSRDHAHVILRARHTGEGLCLEVEDRCGGLAEGASERFFQPFVQGSGDRRGVGLGLAIARRAIEAHGGRIEVRNLPGIGCVFSAYLPCLS